LRKGIAEDCEPTLREYQLTRDRAVSDVYDALVELITNSDDSYHHLCDKKLRAEDGGPILIEVCEQRKGQPSFIKLYDRAEGMTLQKMRECFKWPGKKSSKTGDRGFMGRGAKDCTVLGPMIVESVKDGMYYKCEVTCKPQFIPWEGRVKADGAIRQRLGIKGEGNGTVVTLRVDPPHKMRRMETMIRDLPWHFALRDILSEESPSKVLIRKKNDPSRRTQKLLYPRPEAELVCDEEFMVPGYPGAEAKLLVWRLSEPFDDPTDQRFKRSGLIIKGRRAIYECSLLHSGIEQNPYAKRYFGRIECAYIDQLMDEYDERRNNDEPHPPENPSFIVDFSRQSGLKRPHPFRIALVQIPSERLRRLIEKDKENDSAARRELLSKETRKKLNKLAKAASKFLSEQLEELEDLSEEHEIDDDFFTKKGVLIYPRYANVAVGQIRPFTLYVSRKLVEAEGVEVAIASNQPAVSILDSPVRLRDHPRKEDVLLGTFRVRGEAVSTGICVHTCGDSLPRADAYVRVVDNKVEEREFTAALEFEHRRYRVKEGSKRSLRLFARYPELVSREATVQVASSDTMSVPVRGCCVLTPVTGSNYAVGDVAVQGRRLTSAAVQISASINGCKASAEVKVAQKDPRGVAIEFDFFDEDLGYYRAAWAGYEGKPNLLKISTRHESIRRYLDSEPASGERTVHFNVLLAEIIAESVCRRALLDEAQARPYEFKDSFGGSPEVTVDTVLTHLQKRLKDFVATAHAIMVSDSDIKQP